MLTAARDVCDLFIDKGQLIVATRDRDGDIREEYRGTGHGPYRELPLAVLVNDQSASASEIVAACLQDHNRAKVVGERTWGKGTVQHVIPVEGGRSVLRLTTASYWRPSNKNIHRFKQSEDTDSWGVMPSPGCEVKMDKKDTSAWIEQRRRRDIVYPPGVAREPLQPADATEFDPVLRRALELFDKVPQAAPTQNAGISANAASG